MGKDREQAKAGIERREQTVAREQIRLCYDRFEALARWKTLVGAVLRRSSALVDVFLLMAKPFGPGRTEASVALFVTDFV